MEEIVKRVLAVARPDRIIVFGSAAAGALTRDSDIDLLVLESGPVEPRTEALRIRSALGGMGFPFDVIVMSTQRFEETKDVIGGIAHPAHKHGKTVYEAA
jgi:predicted nucleotidyltransferase